MPYWTVGKQLLVEARTARVRELLKAVAGKRLSRAELEARSLELASELFDLAEQCVGPDERSRRRRLSRLLGDPQGQLLSVLLTDRVARDKTFEHSAETVSYLVSRLGVPKFMTPGERLQLTLGSAIGSLAPHLTGKLVARHIREEVDGLVFPIEPRALAEYLARRKAEGISVNVNQLGEEVLGEQQALARLGQYIALLERPEVETISVKLSSIFSQIDLFAWDSSQALLAERLRQIYRAAMQEPAEARLPRHGGLPRPGADARSVPARAEEPELAELSAGVVLQAYIPDSNRLQRELSTGRIERRRRGGAPHAPAHRQGRQPRRRARGGPRMSWALPIYASKHEVDANYKRMLLAATEPEAAAAVQLGVASHNLFDLAFGLMLARLALGGARGGLRGARGHGELGADGARA